MEFKSEKSPTIGLVEVPALGLYDPEGNNWTALYRKNTLLSKQVLMADLQAGGFDAQLVNLKAGDCQEPFGEVTWKSMRLTKAYPQLLVDSGHPVVTLTISAMRIFLSGNFVCLKSAKQNLNRSTITEG